VTQNNLGGPYTDTDRKISNDIQTYWTNFAKTGNPNGSGLPSWPKFEPGARPFIAFTGNGPVAGTGLRREICDLFMENLQYQMKALGR
jgi:para-nitrobenzyl esterase